MQAVVKGALDRESTDSGDVINTAIENLIDGTYVCMIARSLANNGWGGL